MPESTSIKMELRGKKTILSTGRTIPVVVNRTENAVYKKIAPK